MDSEVTIWGIIVAVALFTGLGAWMFASAMRQEARAARGDHSSTTRSRRRNLAEAAQRYVGPVSPEVAILNPPLRVALEFVSSLCGFPGFGWLMSTRVAIGLPMLCIGPAIVYGFYPVLLAMTGHLTDSPLIALEYLPYLAVISASSLAIAEYRTARSARHAA